MSYLSKVADFFCADFPTGVELAKDHAPDAGTKCSTFSFFCPLDL